MFIYSAKMNKKKIAAVLIGVAAIVLVLVFVLTGGGDEEPDGDPRTAQLELLQTERLETEEDRLRLLASLGWKVGDPSESMEVRIPAEFSEVYEKYNEIQLDQGLDLADYRGEKVMRYAYRILNHPSGEETVRATLLVKDGQLIGGDVCSMKMDGFMHGLLMPEDTKPDAALTPAQSDAAAGLTVTDAADAPAAAEESDAPTALTEAEAYPID